MGFRDIIESALGIEEKAHLLFEELKTIEPEHELVGYVDDNLLFTPSYDQAYFHRLGRSTKGILNQKHALEDFAYDLDISVKAVRTKQLYEKVKEFRPKHALIGLLEFITEDAITKERLPIGGEEGYREDYAQVRYARLLSKVYLSEMSERRLTTESDDPKFEEFVFGSLELEYWGKLDRALQTIFETDIDNPILKQVNHLNELLHTRYPDIFSQNGPRTERTKWLLAYRQFAQDLATEIGR